MDKHKPVYNIGVAADLVGVSQDTLRNYEREELIKPSRSKGQKRLYSEADLEYIKCLRELIQEGYSIKSLKKLLKYESCYELKNCSEEIKSNCPVIKNKQ